MLKLYLFLICMTALMTLLWPPARIKNLKEIKRFFSLGTKRYNVVK